MRIELTTSSLPRKRSTTELCRLKTKKRNPNEIFKFLLFYCRAGDRVRTGDIQLGRLTLYQLSYSRDYLLVGRAGFEPAKVKTSRFTVCPRWPLEYLPIETKNNFYNKKEPLEGLEPTTC